MSKAFGYGVSTIAANGDLLETYYLSLGLGSLVSQNAPDRSALLAPDALRGVTKQIVDLEIDLAEAPTGDAHCFP